MDRFFKLGERNTSIKREFAAGLITFFSMCYILTVNANMFADPLGTGENVLGVSFYAIYIGTALAAVVGSLLMGLLANMPISQAPAMGENAFFVYTICLSLGMTYANALLLTLFDGLLFVFLSATGLRKKIFTAIPLSVRISMIAGLGIFIAFLGLQNAHIIVPSSSTGVTLASLNILKNDWSALMPILVTVITFFIIVVLAIKKVKSCLLIGLIGGTASYYLLGLTVPGFYSSFSVAIKNPLEAFRLFNTESLGKVFTDGFDFSHFISVHGSGYFVLILITTVLSLCMMDMFDTVGCLYGACEVGNMLTPEGEVPNMNRAMMSDAIATSAGAVLGVSTVSSYIESTAGISAGGRTGLSSVFTAVFFGIAVFVSPLAGFIPSCATAACLVYVGLLMIKSIAKIQWTDWSIAVPAFVTMIMIPLTYNIGFGIAFGMITHVIVSIAAGKKKQLTVGTWIIAILFLLTIVLSH